MREFVVSPLPYSLSHPASQALGWGDKTITEIDLEVGFSDNNYFSRVFRQEAGVSPLTYRLAL